METQNVVIDSESKDNCLHEDPIKFLTRSIESSLWDYSDVYILEKGSINVTGGDDNDILKLYLKIVHHSKIPEQK